MRRPASNRALARALGAGLLCIVACACNGAPAGEEELSAGGSPVRPLAVKSPAFRDGGSIPETYTRDGADRSPAIEIGVPPEGTAALALVCDDPDAPGGTWVHWVLFNLPPETRRLDEGVPPVETLPSGACQGRNDFGKIGYNGPAPPPGAPHRYFFKVYALDTRLDLAPGATKAELASAMKGHVLAKGTLTGTYGR